MGFILALYHERPVLESQADYFLYWLSFFVIFLGIPLRSNRTHLTVDHNPLCSHFV